MRTTSVPNLVQSTFSSTPSSKALPASRKNELALPRQGDAFEAPASRSRMPALMAAQPQTTKAKPAPAAAAISPKDIKPAEWTVFVNLNADNNLESFGKADLNEMEGVGSLEGKLNVIALVDGGTMKSDKDGWNTSSRLMYVTRDPNNSSKVVSREITVDPNSELGKMLAKGKGELNTGDPAVLHAAIDYVQKNIPSKHFMVDLWDHGNDWRGVSYDDHPSSSIDMPGLQKALSGLSQKVDIVSADACLMATVEVADTAKAAGADWLVGSEEVEPGEGWNYTDLLTRMGKLFDGGKEVTSDQMAKAVMESYAAGPSDNVTMSATNLSKLDALNAKLNTFSDALIKAGGLQNKTLRTAYEGTLRFDDADQMDLGDFAKRVAASTTDAGLKAAANDVLKALGDGTVAKGAKGAASKFSASTGLTIYAPKGSVDADYKKTGSAWLNSRWNDVIKTYAKTTTRAAA